VESVRRTRVCGRAYGDGDWCIAALSQSELGTIMTSLLEASLYSKHLGTISGRLAENPESLGIELMLSVVVALLRWVQVQVLAVVYHHSRGPSGKDQRCTSIQRRVSARFNVLLEPF
jgi:hypothetical protein